MNIPTPPRETTLSTSQNRVPLKQTDRSFWVCILILILLLMIIWRHHANSNKKVKTTPPPAVVVSKVSVQDVPVYLTGLGSVTPTYNVTVRTQINGRLLKVLFKEGQMVKTGDILAEIDPAPYQAQLVQYQGQYTRDQALLSNARIDLKRYQVLWKQDSVAQQTLATQESLVKQYEGTVQIDLGLIQSIQVSLAYCHIKSPVDGRIGLRLVDPGNFVQTSDTNGIAVVNTLNPITVVFTIPEDSIAELRQKVYAGETFSVQVFNREQNKLLATGKLLTIDNQIDPNTGTVKLKAEFQNNTNVLFPSQFVNARLLVKVIKNATVIPTAAIQYSQNGSFVYILNADKTVTTKPIIPGITNGNLTSINSGVTPGQLVVTEGADALTNGAKVTLASARK